jgi:hypothetical protein
MAAMNRRSVATLAVVLLLGACSTAAPTKGAGPGDDNAPANSSLVWISSTHRSAVPNTSGSDDGT